MRDDFPKICQRPLYVRAREHGGARRSAAEHGSSRLIPRPRAGGAKREKPGAQQGHQTKDGVECRAGRKGDIVGPDSEEEP